jgi:hypothetical protein
VKRWNQILDRTFDPEMVQIISWNDYGESHCASLLLPVEDLVADSDAATDIAPVTGAQPGSEEWTEGMNRDGWMEMTKWFVRRYHGSENDQRAQVGEVQAGIVLANTLSPDHCKLLAGQSASHVSHASGSIACGWVQDRETGSC